MVGSMNVSEPVSHSVVLELRLDIICFIAFIIIFSIVFFLLALLLLFLDIVSFFVCNKL